VRSSKADLAELFAPIAPGIERMRALLFEQIRESSPAVRDMTDHVARFQGKQLRGALVLLTGEATGNTTDEHAAVAAIVEMIHLATLIHDDVIDGAEVRRRDATVNARWSNYDAVLLGDILFSRAINLLARLGDARALDALTRAVSTLCEGEILQNRHRNDPGVSEALYYEIIEEKTAVLYAAGCELAAHLSGAPPEAVRACATFGLELGCAFQIIDDCLDLFGDEAEVGKSLGTDLKGGKVTLPVILAMQAIGAAASLKIASRLRDSDGASIEAELRSLVQGTGAREEAMQRARTHAERAKAAVRSILDGPSLEEFDAIADFVVARKR
jgi:octaprenyl-diphosphate synthase